LSLALLDDILSAGYALLRTLHLLYESGIRKKPAWIYDADLVELYEKRAKAIITRETIPHHAAEFHMRYFWKDKINFTVVNPEVDASWTPPPSDTPPPQPGIKGRLRLLILGLIRRVFSQGGRNAKLDILPLMRCPKCHSEQLGRKSADEIACKSCDAHFKTSGNIFYIY